MNLYSLLMQNDNKGSKYKNKKIEIDGIQFDSKREAYRYSDLKLLERAGEIKDLQRQVSFELIPKQDGERACSYKADFVYLDKYGRKIVEDTKGVRTKEYIIKRKLMLYRYGIKILEI